jgi:hypothetical protein
MSDTIDWQAYWQSISEGIDTSASGLLTMWNAYTDPGFRSIFMDSSSISSWTGNDVTITATVVGADNERYTVTMFAGPDADDTGMYVTPTVDSIQFNGLTNTSFVNNYDYGTGTLAQDHAWLESLYGGGGGGGGGFEGSYAPVGFEAWGGGGSFDFGSGFNAYGVYSDDNIY